LTRAVVVDESDRSRGTIGVGSTVVIDDDRGERLTVEISSVGGVSPDSPLGRALLGAKEGDEVAVEAPAGAWRARVLAVS
jgi:transcription elongation factor GreA